MGGAFGLVLVVACLVLSADAITEHDPWFESEIDAWADEHDQLAIDGLSDEFFSEAKSGPGDIKLKKLKLPATPLERKLTRKAKRYAQRFDYLKESKKSKKKSKKSTPVVVVSKKELEREKKDEAVSKFLKDFRRKKLVEEKGKKAPKADKVKKSSLVKLQPVRSPVMSGIEESVDMVKKLKAQRAAQATLKRLAKEEEKKKAEKKAAEEKKRKAEGKKWLCALSEQHVLFEGTNKRVTVKKGTSFKRVGESGVYLEVKFCSLPDDVPIDKKAFVYKGNVGPCDAPPVSCLLNLTDEQ